MVFCISTRASRTPKLWHTYVITYGDFMVLSNTATLIDLGLDMDTNIVNVKSVSV